MGAFRVLVPTVILICLLGLSFFIILLNRLPQKDVGAEIAKISDGQDQWVEIMVDRLGQYTYGGSGFTTTEFVLHAAGKSYYFEAFVMNNPKKLMIARKIAIVRLGDKIFVKTNRDGEITDLDLKFSSPNP